MSRTKKAVAKSGEKEKKNYYKPLKGMRGVKKGRYGTSQSIYYQYSQQFRRVSESVAKDGGKMLDGTFMKKKEFMERFNLVKDNVSGIPNIGIIRMLVNDQAYGLQFSYKQSRANRKALLELQQSGELDDILKVKKKVYNTEKHEWEEVKVNIKFNITEIRQGKFAKELEDYLSNMNDNLKITNPNWNGYDRAKYISQIVYGSP